MEKMSRYKYTPLIVFQIILMVLFLVFVDYGGDKDADIKGKNGLYI